MKRSFTLALALTSMPAAAQTPIEVTVVGTSLSRTAGSAHVVREKKLERFEYDDPHAVLREVPDYFPLIEWMFKARFVPDPTASLHNELDLKLGYSDETSDENYLGLTDADLRARPNRRYLSSKFDRMQNHRTQIVLEHVMQPSPELELKTSLYRMDFSRTWRKLNGFVGADIADVLADPDSARNSIYYGVLTAALDASTSDETLLIGRTGASSCRRACRSSAATAPRPGESRRAASTRARCASAPASGHRRPHCVRKRCSRSTPRPATGSPARSRSISTRATCSMSAPSFHIDPSARARMRRAGFRLESSANSDASRGNPRARRWQPKPLAQLLRSRRGRRARPDLWWFDSATASGKNQDMDQGTRERIQSTIEKNPVVLFMKGVRDAPQCGFSAQVVQILDGLLPDYVTVDVLSDPAVRQAIKDFSRWPTIPQLYIRGEFVGGCDIVKELFASGELEQKLGVEAKPVQQPKVTVSAAAAENLRAALESPDEFVRLEIGSRYDHELSVTAKRPGDFEISTGGLTLLVDRSSATRADGVAIDVVKTPEGPAFKITNPNEPARVRPMSAEELKLRLDSGDKLELIDVRSEDEREIAHIEGSKLLDQALLDQLLELDRETTLVFHCHHGPRSQRAAEQFVQRGFKSVYNLVGGIDAWSRDVDPDVAQY